jgi:sucrose-6-phosphate hydrolase SacC (GH32 family)
VELRIFVDRYLVEVFINERQALVAAFPSYGDRRAVNGFTVGAPTTLASIEMWPLRSTQTGYLQAKENRVWQPRVD